MTTDRKITPKCDSDSTSRFHSPASGREFRLEFVLHRLRLVPPLAVLFIAVVGAAGRPSTVLLACTGVSVAGLLLNQPPVRRSLACLWWVGMFFLAWQLLTLLPLPLHSLGSPRLDFFEHAGDKLVEYRLIESGETSFSDQTLQHENQDFDSLAELRDKQSGYGRLSLNQSGTRRFVVVFLGSWSMFWLSVSMSMEKRMRFLAVIVVGGAAVAVLGMIGQHVISHGNRIWWIFEVDHRVAAGPFINRNHFASFCAILSPAALSLVLSPLPLFGGGVSKEKEQAVSAKNGVTRSKKKHHHTAVRRSIRKGWWSDLTLEWRWRLFYILVLAILVVTPILSLSRGGMVMMLAGCFTASMFWVRGRPALALAGTVLMLSVLFLFLFWPSEEMQERVSTLRLLQDASPRRVEMTKEAWSQWRDFPLLGAGADSFRTLNGLYRSKPATSSPLYAENEYVQLLADHGLLGLLVFMVLFIALLAGFLSNFHERYRRTRSFRVLRGSWSTDPEIRRRHRELYPPVVSLPVMAAIGGVIVGLLLHISCDFPLRVPLNAFLAAALLGLVMPLPSQNRRDRHVFWRFPIFLLLLLTGVFLYFWSGDEMRLDEPTYLKRADTETLLKAAASSPSYWVVWAQLSQRLRERADAQFSGEGVTQEDRFDPFELYHFGVGCLETAAEYSPHDPRLWRALSRAARRDPLSTKETVTQALKNAALRAPGNLSIWREWFEFTKKHGTFEEIWRIPQQALDGARSNIAAVVWRDARAWARDQGLEAFYLQALETLVELQPEREQWRREFARAAEDMGDYEQAVEQRRYLAELAPEDWRNRKRLGVLLLRMGREREANRAFEEAIRLRPDKREELERLWRNTVLEKS